MIDHKTNPHLFTLQPTSLFHNRYDYLGRGFDAGDIITSGPAPERYYAWRHKRERRLRKTARAAVLDAAHELVEERVLDDGLRIAAHERISLLLRMSETDKQVILSLSKAALRENEAVLGLLCAAPLGEGRPVRLFSTPYTKHRCYFFIPRIILSN